MISVEACPFKLDFIECFRVNTPGVLGNETPLYFTSPVRTPLCVIAQVVEEVAEILLGDLNCAQVVLGPTCIPNGSIKGSVMIEEFEHLLLFLRRVW